MEITEEHFKILSEAADYINYQLKPIVQNPRQLTKEDVNQFCSKTSIVIGKLNQIRVNVKHQSFPEIFNDEGEFIK